MTYFGFLLVFLVIPIVLLWVLNIYDARRGTLLPASMRSWPSWIIVAAHCIIAVAYTTPWDNYLVATRVWWYDPNLVTGVLIGYVPIEEYTFFILQPLLTGAWLLLMARHLPVPLPMKPMNGLRIRRIATGIVFVLWLFFVGLLVSGWRPGTYLGLLMVWALPPVMIQTAFGADILWHHRRKILLTIIPMTLYLAASDKLAIANGVWTIDPEQSLQAVGVLLLGRLPLEEFLFFLMTNVLVTLGIALVASTVSKERAERYVAVPRSSLRRGQRRSDWRPEHS